MTKPKSSWSYFASSIVVGVIGLAIGAATGFYYGGTWTAAASALLIVTVLSVLEVSLSFDNAVVNATVLRDMDEVWRKRFITWGILVAVFGMRLVFPLVIVAVVAHLGPWEAVVLAFTDPTRYEAIMSSVHVQVSAFGGTFLLMVGLSYFLDEEKTTHWIRPLEKPLASLGRVEALAVGVTVAVIVLMAETLTGADSTAFLFSALYGLLTFMAVEILGHFLSSHGAPNAGGELKRSGLASFLYLEVLDASFSFDGVVGALAISNNLIIIMVGLGVGAMFVRSLTILLVDKGTLDEFVFLEHGAFYAIIALALMMYMDTLMHIPEVVTGLLGAAFIGLSVISSIRHRQSGRLST